MHTTKNRPARQPASIGQSAGTVLRHALFASFLAFAGGAQAQDPGPWLINSGGDLGVVYGTGPRTPVGGGAISLTGGADDRVITYGAAAEIHARRGAVGEILGGGTDTQVVYRQPAMPAAAILARAAAAPQH
jgi:hypothetical protein